MNIKTKSAEYVAGQSWLFQCPICGEAMHVEDFKSLICTNRHTFDFAKQGYLNLLTNPPKTKYDKTLFTARRKLMKDDGFFDPVIETLAHSIAEKFEGVGTVTILDTGCGEGTHLAKIYDLLHGDETKAVTGVGIDIAKEGILAAAKEYHSQIWCVADLANTPFSDHQFEVILNILSPSNYHEFNRLLNKDGILIKVVPRSNYLKELRQAFYTNDEKQTYSNEDVVTHFQESFTLIDSKVITYTKLLERDSLEALVEMTPLSWSSSQDKKDKFLEQGNREITVDLELLIGKKKD